MAHYESNRRHFLISVTVLLIAVVLLLLVEGSFGMAAVTAFGIFMLMRLALAPKQPIDV